MLLKRTISQLDIGYVCPDRATELGQLGYMQWLGALKPMAHYREEAMQAYTAAMPFIATSPAIAVFCDLLLASMRVPIEPLPLALPRKLRRGGARARRAAT
ncbi:MULTISPECIES: hypothetical protein [Shimia]|uniref:hypothetical protein n=1 Tax=Shimia TaxID=573139 RepID=UPI001FB1FEB7|nr:MULTISPECIES: hypothetical protein [Shimia]MDV4143986.1 hypothetical protein [Shimia sp. FJ5]